MKGVKTKSLQEVVEKIESLKKRGKTIGLITGCFDILHLGHVRLLRFAKERVDCLVVGLESDESIRINKGKGRPVFNYSQRAEILSEMESVDFIFGVENEGGFDLENPPTIYGSIIGQLRPDVLFTNKATDNYWRNKERDAKKFKVKLVTFDEVIPTSSTKLIGRLS